MATVDEMVVKWSMDSTGFDKGLTSINKSMNSLKSEFKASDSYLRNFGTTTEQLRNKQQYLTNAMELQKQKVETLRRSYENTKNATGENSEATQRLANQVNNAVAYYNNLQGQLNTVNNELNNQQNAWDKVSDKLSELSKKCVDMGKSLSKNVTAPIAALAGLSIKSFNDVDEGYDNLIKATGATGEAAEDLEKTYKNVASNVNASFGDIGSALGEINTRFAFTGEEAEKCTEKFLQFAEINGTDVTNSVKLVSRAMGDAGISSSNYSQVLDQLTVAAQASGISIDTLAGNITKYGAPMRALGMDTKESISIFAAWEKAGVNTEIAFSGMKKAIGNWGKEGKDAREEFKKTLEEIKNCPSIAEATSKAIEIFGQKAGPDLADAIQGGRFEYNDFLNLLEGSEGTVTNTFNQVQDGTDKYKIAMNNLKLAGSELGGSILQTLTPIFNKLADILKNVAKWFNSLDDGTKRIIVTVGGIVAAIGPALLIVAKVISSVKTIISALRTVKTVIAAVNAVLLANPIVLIVAAIVALIAIVVVLYKKCEWFRDGVKAVFNGIKDAFFATIDWIKEKWNSFKDLIGTGIAIIKRTWKELCDKVSDAWDSAGRMIKDVWNGVKETVVGIAQGMVNSVIKAVNFCIRALNKLSFDVPDWIPGIGGERFGFNIKEIQEVNWLYKGGIIDNPTVLGNIGVGDKYKGTGRNAEAIIPLDSMYKNIRNIVKEEKSNQPIYVVVNVDNNMDSKAIGKAVTTEVTKNISRNTKSYSKSKGGVRYA